MNINEWSFKAKAILVGVLLLLFFLSMYRNLNYFSEKKMKIQNIQKTEKVQEVETLYVSSGSEESSESFTGVDNKFFSSSFEEREENSTVPTYTQEEVNQKIFELENEIASLKQKDVKKYNAFGEEI